MADLSERIEQVAGRPASVETDGLKTSQHSLKDLVAADEHLSKKEVTAVQPANGMRLVRMIHKGKYG